VLSASQEGSHLTLTFVPFYRLGMVYSKNIFTTKENSNEDSGTKKQETYKNVSCTK
jgi:hypothetical protein